MKRILVAATIAAALPLLAACSGAGESPLGTADAVAPTQVTPTDGSPDIATGDPFCDLAVENVEVSQQISEQTAGLSNMVLEAMQSGDMAAINQWGTDLVALDQQTLQFYADGRQYIEDDEVVGAWDLMEQFVNDYSLAIATEAATATDANTLLTNLGALSSDTDTMAAINFGPQAATTIREYIIERCGDISAG